MVGALGRASRGTSAARPWGRREERVVRGWRAWARLARHFCRASVGEMGGEGGLGEDSARGTRRSAGRRQCHCSGQRCPHPIHGDAVPEWVNNPSQSIKSSGTEGQAASHTDASVKGAHVANREFALLFGAAFCDDFEEFSDIQVLWADMFALSAFDTLVRCCRLCGEP